MRPSDEARKTATRGVQGNDGIERADNVGHPMMETVPGFGGLILLLRIVLFSFWQILPVRALPCLLPALCVPLSTLHSIPAVSSTLHPRCLYWAKAHPRVWTALACGDPYLLPLLPPLAPPGPGLDLAFDPDLDPQTRLPYFIPANDDRPTALFSPSIPNPLAFSLIVVSLSSAARASPSPPSLADDSHLSQHGQLLALVGLRLFFDGRPHPLQQPQPIPVPAWPPPAAEQRDDADDARRWRRRRQDRDRLQQGDEQPLREFIEVRVRSACLAASVRGGPGAACVCAVPGGLASPGRTGSGRASATQQAYEPAAC